MPNRPLSAHSLAEVYLYLMITPCPQCGRGPLRGGDARPVHDDGHSGVIVPTTCNACHHELDLRFEISTEELAAARNAGPTNPARVNPTDQPSQIIDVAGWVALFRVIADAAARTSDRVEGRKVGFEAAQCLDEALKFYEDDNDLPPDSAFFTDAARRRHLEHPDRLARSRLVNLRAKLPDINAMEKQISARKQNQPWWRRWLRPNRPQ